MTHDGGAYGEEVAHYADGVRKNRAAIAKLSDEARLAFWSSKVLTS